MNKKKEIVKLGRDKRRRMLLVLKLCYLISDDIYQTSLI